MKVRDLIGHSMLTRDQFITLTDHASGTEYSTEGIGRYDFGKDADTVLSFTVHTFHPTVYGIHIDAEDKRRMA